MKTIVTLSLFILGLFFVSCLDSQTTIKVKTDGSGEITQVFLMSEKVLSMFSDMSTLSSEDKEGAVDAGADLKSMMMDKEKLNSHAKAMGEGVELSSMEPIEKDGFTGYRAVYSFRDINKLKFNQNPGELLPLNEAGGGSPPAGTGKEFITFSFKPGAARTLTINFPAPEKERKDKLDAKRGGMEKADAESIEMFKQIYKDMKILMQVEVEGTILETNAAHRSGPTVVLLDIDFNSILKDKKSFDALVKGNVETLEEMKQLVRAVKGLKMEFQRNVFIKF